MTEQFYERVEDNGLAGFSSVRRPQQGRWGFQRQNAALHEARVAAAFELLTDVMTGKAPSWALKEAIAPTSPQAVQVIAGNYPELVRESMSSSDFPLLMGDVLDRMLLARFREVPQVWRAFTKVSRPLRDFRTVRRVAADGLEGQYQLITEDEGVKFGSLSETGYTYAPDLYGLGARLSFRMIMNDDLDAFDSIPDRLGRGGRRSIAKFVTSLYMDSSGPHASLVSAGNGNLLTGNPDLAIDSLGTAVQTFLGLLDSDSEPIEKMGITLVTGPGLTVTAKNLINQLTVDVTQVGGVTGQTVRVNNWIVGGLSHVIDPYIPIVATSNGATSWCLFANPNEDRPALEVGFLTGFEEPALYQKAPNTQRVGGGLDPMAGDFYSMASEYKGVMGYGGTRMDPKSVVGSNGSNA